MAKSSKRSLAFHRDRAANLELALIKSESAFIRTREMWQSLCAQYQRQGALLCEIVEDIRYIRFDTNAYVVLVQNDMEKMAKGLKEHTEWCINTDIKDALPKSVTIMLERTACADLVRKYDEDLADKVLLREEIEEEIEKERSEAYGEPPVKPMV